MVAANEVQVPLNISNSAEPTLIYVDGAQTLQLGSGVVKLNLFQDLIDLMERGGEASNTRVIAARLVMPVEAFIKFSDWLSQAAEEIKEIGVSGDNA